MDKRLLDAGKVAEDMGLGVSYMNEGYPNPFLIVVVPGPLISHRGVSYKFADVKINMGVQDTSGYNSNQLYYTATQDPSRVLHPHMSSSSTPIFCFGDNLEELTEFLRSGKYVDFFVRAVASINTFSPYGAYRDIADVDIAGLTCYCATRVRGASVCDPCKVRIPGKGEYHFLDVTQSSTGELTGTNPISGQMARVDCPNCGRNIFYDEMRRSALSGDEGCISCMEQYGDHWYSEEEMDYSEDGDEDTRMPIHLMSYCQICEQHLQRGVGRCARVDCDRG